MFWNHIVALLTPDISSVASIMTSSSAGASKVVELNVIELRVGTFTSRIPVEVTTAYSENSSALKLTASPFDAQATSSILLLSSIWNT